MTNRKIYLFLSFLYIALCIFFAFLINPSAIAILITIAFILGSSVLNLLFSLPLIETKWFREVYALTPFAGSGLITLSFKKIYYSDLGYFWIRIGDNGQRVYVYKQTPLLCYELFSVDYYGDIENLRSSIKDRLDDKFREELKRNSDLNKIKEWNGYIDKRSEREGKINNIIGHEN